MRKQEALILSRRPPVHRTPSRTRRAVTIISLALLRLARITPHHLSAGARAASRYGRPGPRQRCRCCARRGASVSVRLCEKVTSSWPRTGSPAPTSAKRGRVCIDRSRVVGPAAVIEPPTLTPSMLCLRAPPKPPTPLGNVARFVASNQGLSRPQRVSRCSPCRPDRDLGGAICSRSGFYAQHPPSPFSTPACCRPSRPPILRLSRRAARFARM